jgi:hypothetical protein
MAVGVEAWAGEVDGETRLKYAFDGHRNLVQKKSGVDSRWGSAVVFLCYR